jgi:hypothetical protein
MPTKKRMTLVVILTSVNISAAIVSLILLAPPDVKEAQKHSDLIFALFVSPHHKELDT